MAVLRPSIGDFGPGGFAGGPPIIINGACQIGLVAASVLSAFERLRELHRLNVRREPVHAVESIV